jgi:hypothetical protein
MQIKGQVLKNADFLCVEGMSIGIMGERLGVSPCCVAAVSSEG